MNERIKYSEKYWIIGGDRTGKYTILFITDRLVWLKPFPHSKSYPLLNRTHSDLVKKFNEELK